MFRLVFGYGYLGQRVARRWLDAGDDVFAVTRRRERVAEMIAAGVRPIVADVTQAATLRDLPRADTVLFAVGYDRTSGLSIGEVYVAGLQNVLVALPSGLGRFIYVSSTGVYGQNDGSWVDEDSITEPTRDGGRACLAAERLLLEHAFGEKAVILRMGGIYGPGRIPRLKELLAGASLAAPSRGYLNLIHVDDAALCAVWAEQRGGTRCIYNVCDGQPVLREAYYNEAARLFGAPPPRFAPAPSDSPAAQRAAADKRVRNARLVREIAPALAFPSYREGLAAILAGPE